MAESERAALVTAYRNSVYVLRPCALSGGEALTFKVGVAEPTLEARLARAGVSHWAFLTAWNPRSQKTSREENLARQHRLVAELTARGFHPLPAEGRAEDGAWSEESLFVPGMNRVQARELGRAWEQNAVVVGERGEPPRLVFCFDPAEG